MLPRAIHDVAAEFTRLPGVGPKTAERLAVHLLRQPRGAVTRLADTLRDLHDNVSICQQCFNLAEEKTCAICQSQMRDASLLCIVTDALDVEALEKTGSFNGRYHVLGGVLSPINGIGPDQLTIAALLQRLDAEPITEVIFALDHTLESDATIRHIAGVLKNRDVTVSRIARGLPTGGDLRFADQQTLTAALSGRAAL